VQDGGIVCSTVLIFSTGSALSPPTISSFLLWSKKLYPAVCLMKFISAVFSLLTSICFNFQISRSCKVHGTAKL
jgi:hypothetical protein